jgi:hypothetical protein
MTECQNPELTGPCPFVKWCAPERQFVQIGRGVRGMECEFYVGLAELQRASVTVSPTHTGGVSPTYTEGRPDGSPTRRAPHGA